MKSICIKTNNQEIIEYLLATFEKLPVRYGISNEKEFYEIVAIVLKSAIEKFYEKKMIRKCIQENYFYLNEMEQEYVLKISKQIMNLPDNKIGYKNKLLKNLVKKYIMEHKSLVIDGFVNFRTKEYRELLDHIVEVSVVSFLELTSF